MVELKKNENGIEIKNSNNFILALFAVGLVVIFLLIAAIVCISTDKSIDAVEIFTFVICLVFSVILLGYSYIDSTKLLTLNDSGVTIKSVLKKDGISWKDIKDFGISYYGRGKGKTFYYCLYFSREKQKDKNEYYKKISSKTIKFVFMQDDYERIRNDVISYCSERALEAPFIGKEKR